MTETAAKLAERLRREGQKTVEFFRTLPTGCWEQVVYSDRMEWSVRQILAHLAAAEAGMQELIRDVLAGGGGAPETLDLDEYNLRQVAALENASTQDLLRRFEDLRAVTAGRVECLSLEDLQRSGRHPWLGVAPIEEILKLLYIHNQIHQRDIRRVVLLA